MNRSAFGGWGSELDADEFGQALAAIGFLTATHPSWPGPILGDAATIAERLQRAWDNLESLQRHWHETPSREVVPCEYFFAAPASYLGKPSPREVAAAWALFKNHVALPRRFEIRVSGKSAQTDPEGPRWILDQLLCEAVGAGSAYFPLDPLARTIEWRWPIRIGFLDDPASQQLRSAYDSVSAGSRMVERLTDAVDMAERQGPVDMLVLPGNLQAAVSALENSPFPVFGYAVAIPGGDDEAPWSVIESGRSRICDLTQAQAVVLAEADFRDWLYKLVRTLAQNETLDQALFDISYGGPRPCVWASQPFLTSARLLAFTRRLVARELSPAVAEAGLDLDPETADRLDLRTANGPASVQEILRRLSERIHSIGWLNEGDGASVSSEVNRALEAKLCESGEPKPIRPRGNRHLQADVFTSLHGDEIRMQDVFGAGRAHVVAVHIGPPTAGTVMPGEFFHEDQLPPTNDGGHLLTVVFFEPALMKEPQVRTVFLPRSGPSQPCRFRLPVSEEAVEVDARITVLHENRLLQTGLLRGLVRRVTDDELWELKYRRRSELLETRAGRKPEGEPPEGPAEEARIRLEPSVAVRRAIAELGARPRFGGALVLNHAGAKPGMLYSSREQSRLYLSHGHDDQGGEGGHREAPRHWGVGLERLPGALRRRHHGVAARSCHLGAADIRQVEHALPVPRRSAQRAPNTGGFGHGRSQVSGGVHLQL
jgi:hypothetical protein